jgi:hypothetical protein
MKILFTSLLLLTFSTFFCQSNNDSIIINNRIKEVRILDSENKLASITKYDLAGKLIFNSLDNFCGSTFLKTSITKFYDDNGKLIKTLSTHSSFEEPTIWIYEYDENGNKSVIKTQDGNLVFQFFYDNSNFLVKKLSYNDNSIRETTTFEKKDNDKKIVSKIVGDFIKNRINTTTLDENGNEIKIESYDGNKINFSCFSEYQNNKIIKTTYNSGYGNFYFYDSVGRLIKRQQFKIENGTEIFTNFEEFKYDNKGLIQFYSENIYLSEVTRQYKYQYDFYN